MHFSSFSNNAHGPLMQVGFNASTLTTQSPRVSSAVASVVIGLAALLGDTGYTLADCSPALPGSEPDITAICTGEQLSTYGTGTEVFTSLTVEAGASISVEGANEVRGVEANGITATNNGVISASVISGNIGEAFGIYSGAQARVTNTETGTISAASASGNVHGIYSTLNANVTNEFGGAISASTLQGYAYGIKSDATAVVENAGSISATSDYFPAYGVFGGSAVTVINKAYGTINASSVNDWAVGVYGGTTATVTNGSGATISASSDSAHAYGVYASGLTDIQTNGGVIS
jgi:hypothetical protein